MNDAMEFKDTAFYPYNYRGEVMDDADPLRRGRVKVKVYPMFSGVETAVLPWAAPATSLFEGAGTDAGSFTPPAVGTKVWVFFEAGHITQPVYFACAPDGVAGVPAEGLVSYPNRKVWKTASGITIIIDDSTHEIKVSQPTGGGFITITADGKFKMGNAVAELLDVISTFINDWQSYYMPGSGGNVLYNPLMATELVALKLKIAALKGT
jgi:hypothetical protein